MQKLVEYSSKSDDIDMLSFVLDQNVVLLTEFGTIESNLIYDEEPVEYKAIIGVNLFTHLLDNKRFYTSFDFNECFYHLLSEKLQEQDTESTCKLIGNYYASLKEEKKNSSFLGDLLIDLLILDANKKVINYVLSLIDRITPSLLIRIIRTDTRHIREFIKLSNTKLLIRARNSLSYDDPVYELLDNAIEKRC